MKILAHINAPEVEVELTGQEIYDLWKVAKQHHDAHCRSYAFEGGRLFGFLNMLETDPVHPDIEAIKDKKVRVTLDFRTLDTLAKICEMMSYVEVDSNSLNLWFEIMSELHSLGELQSRTVLA
jgi:hypothetical protein